MCCGARVAVPRVPLEGTHDHRAVWWWSRQERRSVWGMIFFPPAFEALPLAVPGKWEAVG